MKMIRPLLLLLVLFSAFAPHLRAQITNLTVNGSTSNFSITQGQPFTWRCNVPVGSTMTCEIWLDLNGNGVIDQGVDKSVFGTFTQTDGDTVGNNGPSDMDGLENGQLYLNLPGFVFAPGKYVYKFTNNGDTHYITGTVLAMTSPAYTISGKVTPPVGVSALNILVSAEAKDNGNFQSFALTDDNGNYSMNFLQSAEGMSFTVKVKDDYSPSVSSPSDTVINLTKSFTGINFAFSKPAAQITGYLKGDDKYVFANTNVYCYPDQGNGNSNKNAKTDANGFYQFGFTANELSSYSAWRIQADGTANPHYLMPQTGSITVHQSDSLRYNLTAYTVDDSITGKITVNGFNPKNLSFQIYASVQDTAQNQTTTDPTTGAFTIYVSKKFSDYYLGVNDLPSGMGYDNSQGNNHPGDKNVVLKIMALSWIQQNSPTANNLLSVAALATNAAWASGANGTLLLTTDGGNNWQQMNTNTSISINSVFFTDTQNGWAAGETGAIERTTNGGASWKSQTSSTTMTINRLQFLDVNNGWAAGGSNGQSLFLKTTDGGSTWTTVTTGLTGVISSVSMVSTTTGWVICSNSIYKTTNGGTSWNQENVSGAFFNQIKFFDMNNGWAVGSPGSVYHSTDGGNSWTMQNVNSPTIHAVYCLNATTAFLAADNGNIYKTTNSGNVWTSQLTNYYGQLNAISFTDANNGWVVGSGGEILHTTNGGVTFIKDASQTLRAKEFQLMQNYPNPFNPETKISFSLAAEGKVTLKLYDILGRELKTLVNDVLSAGTHSVSLNASALPSGIYLYTLTQGANMQTRKMLLLK